MLWRHFGKGLLFVFSRRWDIFRVFPFHLVWISWYEVSVEQFNQYICYKNINVKKYSYQKEVKEFWLKFTKGFMRHNYVAYQRFKNKSINQNTLFKTRIWFKSIDISIVFLFQWKFTTEKDFSRLNFIANNVLCYFSLSKRNVSFISPSVKETPLCYFSLSERNVSFYSLVLFLPHFSLGERNVSFYFSLSFVAPLPVCTCDAVTKVY